VGRAEDNNIILPANANGVGRYHAQIIIEPDGQMAIQDLNSVNGTFVNGEVVQGVRAFGPQDRILLGQSYEFPQSLLQQYKQQYQGHSALPQQFVRCICGAVIQTGKRCDRCGQ